MKANCNKMKRALRPLAIAAILTCFYWTSPIRAARHPRAADPNDIDWKSYQEMAVDLMQQYLRVNTSNPPGNEIAAAQFLKSILDREGVQSEIFEYTPGRANIIARIKGNGSKRPIVLLNHM